MIMLAVMLIAYGACCFTGMRRIAVVYFAATVINMAVYPVFDSLDPEKDAGLIDWIYIYGDTEEFAKIVLLLFLSKFSHRWLIYCLILHIINHSFNTFHYGAVNNAIILCEIGYFLRGGASELAANIRGLFTRNLRPVDAGGSWT